MSTFLLLAARHSLNVERACFVFSYSEASGRTVHINYIVSIRKNAIALKKGSAKRRDLFPIKSVANRPEHHT